MTQPGAITNRVPPGNSDLARRVHELERLVQQLLAAARTPPSS